VRTDGRPFSDTIRTISDTAQSFSFPLVDESGAFITSTFQVATGANGNGVPEPGDSGCRQLVVTQRADSMGGDPGDGEQFSTRAQSISCSSGTYRLYCFGIDYVAPLDHPAAARLVQARVLQQHPLESRRRWQHHRRDTLQEGREGPGLCFDGATCPFIALLTPNAIRRSLVSPTLACRWFASTNVRVATSVSGLLCGQPRISPGVQPTERQRGATTTGPAEWNGTAAKPATAEQQDGHRDD